MVYSLFWGAIIYNNPCTFFGKETKTHFSALILLKSSLSPHSPPPNISCNPSEALTRHDHLPTCGENLALTLCPVTVLNVTPAMLRILLISTLFDNKLMPNLLPHLPIVDTIA